MQKHEVKIGERYHLVSLGQAEKIDDDFRKNGYHCATGIVEWETGGWGTESTVEITSAHIDDIGKFNAIFPSGAQWVVCAEWLLPTTPEVNKPKPMMRLIRG